MKADVATHRILQMNHNGITDFSPDDGTQGSQIRGALYLRGITAVCIFPINGLPIRVANSVGQKYAFIQRVLGGSKYGIGPGIPGRVIPIYFLCLDEIFPRLTALRSIPVATRLSNYLRGEPENESSRKDNRESSGCE